MSSERRTTVVNVKWNEWDVYIGRTSNRNGLAASKWQNPYRISKRANMEERLACIQLYREHLERHPLLMEMIGELRGKRLGCWCRPPEGFRGRLMCHGQILAGLADGVPPESIE